MLEGRGLEGRLAAEAASFQQEYNETEKIAAENAEKQSSSANSETAETAQANPEKSEPVVVEQPLSGDFLRHEIDSSKEYRRHIQAELDKIPSDGTRREEREGLQQMIDEASESLQPLVHQAALEVFDKLRNGEKISEEEQLYIIEDLAANQERSAIAELSMHTQGFNSFQESLGKLGVKSVRVEDLVVHLENNREANFFKKMWGKGWVQEQAKKLGVSAGISTATVGAIALLGGPVSWAALLGGLAGGTVARLGVEKWRYAKLGKDGLGEKTAEDLLSHVYKLQTQAGEALNESNQEKRAQLIGEILAGIEIDETENLKNYHALEKRSAKLKAVWGTVGAVAGAGLTSLALRGAELSSLVEKAANEGVRLDLDGDGLAHLVKENADGAWRHMIEQSDPDHFYSQLVETKGQAFADAHWQELWDNNIHAVIDAGAEASVSPLPIQDLVANPDVQFFHFNLSDQAGEGLKEAVRDHLNHQINVKTAAVIASMAGASAIAEGANLARDYYLQQPGRLGKKDQTLIYELEAKAISGGYRPPVPDSGGPEGTPAAAMAKEKKKKPKAETGKNDSQPVEQNDQFEEQLNAVETLGGEAGQDTEKPVERLNKQEANPEYLAKVLQLNDRIIKNRQEYEKHGGIVRKTANNSLVVGVRNRDDSIDYFQIKKVGEGRFELMQGYRYKQVGSSKESGLTSVLDEAEANRLLAKMAELVGKEVPVKLEATKPQPTSEKKPDEPKSKEKERGQLSDNLRNYLSNRGIDEPGTLVGNERDVNLADIHSDQAKRVRKDMGLESNVSIHLKVDRVEIEHENSEGIRDYWVYLKNDEGKETRVKLTQFLSWGR